MKFGIIILSHADNQQKQERLSKAISSLKTLDIPIILSTNCSVKSHILNKVDYCLYDSNNIIFDETEFFDSEIPTQIDGFHHEFHFGDVTTKSYLKKMTYFPSVFNLLINSINYSKFLQLDYVLITEYDYIYCQSFILKIKEVISKIKTGLSDGFYIPCKLAGVQAVTPIPIIVPVKKFSNYTGSELIKDVRSYLRIAQNSFNLVEQWTYNFLRYLICPCTIPYQDFLCYMETMDREFGQLITSENYNPLFGPINSGIFIEKCDKTKWMYSICNGTQKKIDTTIQILQSDKVIFEHSGSYEPNCWYYKDISSIYIDNFFNSNLDITINELFKFDSVEKLFSLTITKENIDRIQKSKFFYKTSL